MIGMGKQLERQVYCPSGRSKRGGTQIAFLRKETHTELEQGQQVDWNLAIVGRRLWQLICKDRHTGMIIFLCLCPEKLHHSWKELFRRPNGRNCSIYLIPVSGNCYL